MSATPTFDVTSIGESMLRLSVPRGERLPGAQQFQSHVGGAESNVLAALSGLGRRTAWHSQLPDNALGLAALRQIRAAGVDTASVTLEQTGGRMGLYFYEPPTGPLLGEVIYDRAGSSFSRIDSTFVNWNRLLDTRVLHLTGITPALGPRCRELTVRAIDMANDAGVLVSLDVNYRRRLWSASEAAEVLVPLFSKVSLLICGVEDARALLGANGDPITILRRLGEAADGRDVVLTRGAQGAIALVGGKRLTVPAVEVEPLDELGGGDAFAAGLLDGWLEGSLEVGLRQGAMLAAAKLTQRGDMVTLSRKELTERLSARTTGRILR